MKFTMSPSRAYLLGFWKSRRGTAGVGVDGRREACEIFVKLCMDEGWAEPNKIKFEENNVSEFDKCYFYNSALRTHLESEIGKREERLKYKNEFAANYFAGVFDAKGGFAELKGKEILYFIGDEIDEMILLRLGFRVKKEGKRIAIFSDDFYGWIHPYLKMQRSKKF